MIQVNGINIKLIRVSSTMTLQALIEEIQEFWKMYNYPVFIELPNQPIQHIEAFYRSDSFHMLDRLKREYRTPILFIIPTGVRLMNEAKRLGFPAYSSLGEGVEALSHVSLYTTRSSSGQFPPYRSNPSSEPSLSYRNNSPSGPIPPYMSNPQSWSSLPFQNLQKNTYSKQGLDSFHTPFDAQVSHTPQNKPEIVVPPPSTHNSVRPYADKGTVSYNDFTASSKELDFATQPSVINKNAYRRSIYKRSAFIITTIVLAFLLLTAGFLVLLNSTGARQARSTTSSAHKTTTPFSPTHGIGVERAPDGEYIGLSDGSFAFDTNRPDGATKQQGAEKLRAGDIGTALSLWHEAVTRDTNDAEALIYLENQHVISSGNPYVTLVVGTMDTGTYVNLGRDDLQGAYVTQKEYNIGQKLPGKLLVRLLIANSGNDKEYTDIVAQQIVQAAKSDPTIVGVMGWPYSSRTLNVVKTLSDAHIPIVSQMASSVLLTGISPYFFRIVPPDSTQATTGAIFTENILHAKAASLFIDSSDAYSVSIGNAFAQKFKSDGNRIVVTEHYTVGKPATVTTALQDALLHSPDVIYFAGLADDANAVLAHLPTEGPFAQIKVVGGDGLYSIGSYSKDAVVQRNFHRLCFSAFAYADTWGYLSAAGRQPAFFSEYPTFFDPYQQHGTGAYGYSRADGDVILSYDATMVLLEAYKLVLSTKEGVSASVSVTPAELRDALASITASNPIQGATGRIAFNTNNDPLDKAVVMLAVSSEGRIQLQSVQGKFFK
ncbi:MAG: hypothetical protein NVS4B12_23510 [Ktedonobacteraceae bacterium]